VAAAVPAIVAGAPAPEVVAAVASITALATVAALTTAARSRAASPGRWSRTVGAALTGAGIGVLLVADPSIGWTTSAAPALALLPSAAGALWAGQHLWKLSDAFPRALSGVPACEDVQSPPTPIGTLIAAIGRLTAVTAAGSAALLVLTTWLGSGPNSVGVLAGFGAVALASLLVGLLESLGRPSFAAAGIAAGVAAELLVRLAGTPFTGAALLAGGTVAVLVQLPAAFALLSRPARTLATTLWIT
jgi:hypothetical protein